MNFSFKTKKNLKSRINRINTSVSRVFSEFSYFKLSCLKKSLIGLFLDVFAIKKKKIT